MDATHTLNALRRSILPDCCAIVSGRNSIRIYPDKLTHHVAHQCTGFTTSVGLTRDQCISTMHNASPPSVSVKGSALMRLRPLPSSGASCEDMLQRSRLPAATGSVERCNSVALHTSADSKRTLATIHAGGTLEDAATIIAVVFTHGRQSDDSIVNRERVRVLLRFLDHAAQRALSLKREEGSLDAFDAIGEDIGRVDAVDGSDGNE